MIKKPWQIWSLFGLILLVVLPAMVWLTMQINEADRLREVDRQETELARRQAELQERINSALYRMDFWTTPLVAQEAARPYYLYEPFYQVGSTAPTPQIPSQVKQQVAQAQTNLPQQQIFSPPNLNRRPSPLLFGTSEYVVMHFQITPDNQVTSPQNPVGDGQNEAIANCNISEDTLFDNNKNLDIASQFCKYETLAFQCASLPSKEPLLSEQLLAQNSSGQFQTVYRDLGFEPYSNNWGKVNLPNQPPKLLPSKELPVKGGRGGKGSKSEQQSLRNNDRGNREYAQRAQTASLNASKFRDQYLNGYNDLALPNESDPNFPINGSGNNDDVANSEPTFTGTGFVREGVMRPIWLDGRLLLARRVEGVDKKIVQCCWLNWEKIQAELKKEVADLLPECELKPVTEQQDLHLASAMATLPVQLVVNSDKLLSTLALNSDPQTSSRPSALKLSMLVAWIGLGMAAFASALLLRGVIKLSERRAAFVSAVTHELRTPLTTFRMYSEMLAEEMVPDEKRGEYAETMKHEADRLSNLVENVLQFAKLERGTGLGRSESLNMLDLIGRFEDRLHHRASTMKMELSIDLGETAETVVATDASKVEQIVFNLVDNACKYAANSENNKIAVVVQQTSGNINISVRDHGPGVAAKFRKLLFKPFCKSDQDAADTASGVGLGLALCQQMAKSIGGRVILADSDTGAKFVLQFPMS